MSFELAPAFIAEDELLEVTPQNSRLSETELMASASKRRGC